MAFTGIVCYNKPQMKRIYLDNNATTFLDPRVLEAMVEELAQGPSNPSSVHFEGREAKKRLSFARKTIASYLGTSPQNLIFTGSGTEALNLAIHGAKPRGPIITSPIEHAAVYNTLKELGLPLVYLPVDKRGHVDPADLESAIQADTSLIVLSAVNSETGVKNPIVEIASIAHARKIPFLVDGVALLGKEPVTLHPGISAMAFSAHKLHGPKGVGLLACHKSFKLAPQITGGGQEKMLRSGTENLAGIIGFAKAVEILEAPYPHVGTLRDHFESELKKLFPEIKVNGTGPRVGNTSNLIFPHFDGETLLIHLDQAGVSASMGSACSSGALHPSRTLLEMGCTREEALSSIRFSLSRFTTQEEIDQALAVLTKTQAGLPT